MPQKPLSADTDPSITTQYDTETPKPEQVKEFYTLIDSARAVLLTTQRPSLGPVSRSMAIAKRHGPDFLFLANKNSRKFSDLQSSKTVQITYQDSSDLHWISVTGTAVTVDNSDPRIKELYTVDTKAWFGDVGDGVHDGGREDPRISLIEVKAEYVTYWKKTVGMLGFAKEIGSAIMKGEVADTGVTRELLKEDLETARKE